MNTFFQCYLGTVVTYMLVLGLCMVLVDYQQLVFGLCAVEVCVIYTFTLLGADMMYVCHMAVAVILCAVLLLIAKILKQEVKRNEEN